MEKEKEKAQNKKAKQNSYIKYSSVSFQMLAIVLFFAFIGNKIDLYFKFEKPFVMAILSIIGIILAIYTAVKKILKQ